MNTIDLVNLTAEETGQTEAQTETTVKAALKILRGLVARGEPVRLKDFGTFQSRHISDRDERNLQAGDLINHVRVIQFLPAKAFRKEVDPHS